jgi:DNA primase
MSLFPQSFLDDLRAQADIVQVIQDYVPLKKAGASYKGLCPFHAEKTPSFHVNRERGFFHCFGCGTGGDVFKFLELQERIGFQDAVRRLAQRFGLAVPEVAGGGESERDSAEREALLKVHEVAAARFRAQLASPAGTRSRQQLRERGIRPDTIERLGLGYAGPARDALKGWLLAQGFDLPLLVRSGLVSERENGQIVDRFRGRLMIPIARDSGSIVAFAGRAMDADQQPKYLNSPETPIYSKSRVLYGLHLTKGDVRRLGYAVLVEGYFDLAQALQAGVLPVVAACGTALTPQQGQLLRRFTSKVVLSYDPDAAGQGAAARSSQLLVTEGFQVNVALLPPGDDPDGFVRKHGGAAYVERLKVSRPYLEYLIDLTAEPYDFGSDDSRREFLGRMLTIAAQIPDAAQRDQFADRIAHKARITEEVVRAEIRKAAVERRTALTERELPAFGRVKQAEKGLIWSLVHEPVEAARALAELEPADLNGLVTEHVLDLARTLHTDTAAAAVPAVLLARLNQVEAALVTGIAAEPVGAAPPLACAQALKRLRFERERAEVQQEIDRLQDQGAGGDSRRIEALWQRKMDLVQRIETLST